MSEVKPANDDQTPDLEVEVDELTSLLISVISQACHDGPDGEIDSCALTAYADAVRQLAARGYVKIYREYGRRVIGRFRNEKVDELEERRLRRHRERTEQA